MRTSTSIDLILDLVHADTVQCGIADLPQPVDDNPKFFKGLLWAFCFELPLFLLALACVLAVMQIL